MRDIHIPSDAVFVRRTPEFTETSIPAPLRHRHTTKAGVWGRIEVLEGALLYRVLEPVAVETRLSPGQPGIVEPESPHEVQATGPVRFFVAFFERVG